MSKRLLLGIAALFGALCLPAVEISPGEDLLAAAAEHPLVKLLPGEHQLPAALVVSRDLTLLFENGATLSGALPELIVHQSGWLIIEGIGKPGVLRSLAGAGKRGYNSEKRHSVIDLNTAWPAPGTPRLRVHNMHFYAYNGIDGYWNKPDRASLGEIEITQCHFYCEEKGIGFNFVEVAALRVENCLFEGLDEAIQADCPLPGGAIIRGNVIRDFGRRGIWLGKGGQIAEGCTEHLANAVVHDNQLLSGGQRSTLNDSYIFGILIYGHNVSVQGNIVRDVNRGVAVPGEIGQVLRGSEGELIKGIRIETEQAKRRRLAGAAIYLKANRALVQGNICTNSGWRSVIEIKTGGKEHFVSVINNLVDGRALSQEESFAFECHSGRSLWAGNLVYDIPNEAFVVRSGYENTFINNLIVNAKIGFALSGAVPGQGELVSHNRFINVAHPVAVAGTLQPGSGPEVWLPPLARLADGEELPDPGPEWLGRQVLSGEELLVGVQNAAGEHHWLAMAGKLLPRRFFQPTGPELALNADQSSEQPTGVETLDNPLHRGWQMSMTSSHEKQIDPADGHLSYDYENFRTGDRSLRVAYRVETGSWQLRQDLVLPPGRRFRATAWVRGEEPLNLRLSVFVPGGKGYQTRAADNQQWQLLSVDFVTPARAGTTQLRVWSSKTSADKSAWLDSVSVRELVEVTAEGSAVPLVPEELWEVVGEELAYNPDQSSDAELPVAALNKPNQRGWTLVFSPQDKDKKGEQYRSIGYQSDDVPTGTRVLAVTLRETGGNWLLSQPLVLPPGHYRATATLKSNLPKQVTLGVKTAEERTFTAVPKQSTDWQEQEVDFQVVEPQGNTNIRIWAGNFPPDETVLLDAISVRALQRVAPAKAANED